jgi:outer membrane protein, heavy metal efflux system
MDTRYQMSLTQMFPAFGTLGLRESRAEAEALAAMHAFDAKRFIIFDRVTNAFYEYHYLSRAIAITEENHRLLVDLEQAVDAHYRSGAVAFVDLIKVQIEKDRLADRLAALRERQRPQSAGLAALLNLPTDVPLPWPRAEPSGPVLVDEAVLADMLADLNPELKAADAMIEAAVYREELARRSGWPRFMAGTGWMVMPGMEGRGDKSDIGLMAGISLPVWRGRYRAELRETAALRDAVTQDRDTMRNQVRAELSMAVFNFHDAERRIELYQESLIPKAEQALTVAWQAYADGQTDFMTLIDAQRTLLEFQLMAERAIADREIALGEIGCCIGAFGRQSR